MLVARTASCRVVNPFSTRLKLILAEIQPKKRQNVQKTCLLQKAPAVNGLSQNLSAKAAL